MPPLTPSIKPIKHPTIKNCYKPNYIQDHQDFLELDNYIRLRGTSFEGKLLCGGNPLIKWRISSKNEKKSLTASDYYELHQIQKRFNKEKFNFPGYSSSHITHICNQLHKGKPISHIPCKLQMANPHYVHIRTKSNFYAKANKTERPQCVHNKTASCFYVTEHRSRRKKNEECEGGSCEDVELNVQSDSEEERRDVKYPMLVREKTVGRLKERYEFYEGPVRKYLKRYYEKSRYLQTEVFRPTGGWRKERDAMWKGGVMKRMKRERDVCCK